MTELDVSESRDAFADRLSQWLGWTDAIALSAALDGDPADAPARVAGPRASASNDEADPARVRAALVATISEDIAFSTEFAPCRHLYLTRQQAMEDSIGALRGRARAALAARSPVLARLAAVDAVMEQSLGAQERALLFAVPGLLERHFERLRQADPAPDEPGGWFDVFRDTLRGVLLAELDVRFQPVEGLLETLRMNPPTP